MSYRTIGLFVALFFIVAAVIGSIAYVVATRQPNNRISSLNTSSPFLVQFASSGHYLARPQYPNKKLTTTDNEQEALRLFASTNSFFEAQSENAAVLLVSFTANNAGNFLTGRESSGVSTNEVWYLDVDGPLEGERQNNRVECNSYNLETGQGQEWTSSNSWELTSDGFLRYLGGRGDLFLSLSTDGVEATRKQDANKIQLISTQDQQMSTSPSIPSRIRLGSSYLSMDGNNIVLGNKQQALFLKSFNTDEGLLICRCYQDNDFLLLDTGKDEQIQYLAIQGGQDTSSLTLSLKSLTQQTIETSTLWSLDGGNTLASMGTYLSVQNGSIVFSSSKRNPTGIPSHVSAKRMMMPATCFLLLWHVTSHLAI